MSSPRWDEDDNVRPWNGSYFRGGRRRRFGRQAVMITKYLMVLLVVVAP